MRRGVLGMVAAPLAALVTRVTAAEQSAADARTMAGHAATAAGDAEQTAATASSVARGLRDAIDAADRTHADIIAAGVEQLELAVVPVPAMVLVLGTATVDVPVTWDTAFPSATYLVGKPKLLLSSASLIGKTTATVKAQTKTGCTVTVTTSAAVALGQAAVIIHAYRKGAN